MRNRIVGILITLGLLAAGFACFQFTDVDLRVQDRLFDSLVSVRDAGARHGGETPHLGLGLYVVRLVAELHRGSALAHNLDGSRGVEFALRLSGMPRRRMSEVSSDA